MNEIIIKSNDNKFKAEIAPPPKKNKRISSPGEKKVNNQPSNNHNNKNNNNNHNNNKNINNNDKITNTNKLTSTAKRRKE